VATSAAQIAKTGKFGDLRRRLVFLLLALVVYRIGRISRCRASIQQLQQLFSGQQGGILNLFNMFSGGALSRFTVFALGIMPYISASIIMQLMHVVPTWSRRRKVRRVVARSPVHPLRHSGPGAVSVLGIAVALESPQVWCLSWFRLPPDCGGQPDGRHHVPDVAG
jgi:preprotein translocase subunit SecY